MEQSGLEAFGHRVIILEAYAIINQGAFSKFSQVAFATFSHVAFAAFTQVALATFTQVAFATFIQVAFATFTQVAFITFTHEASILEAFITYDASNQGACQEEITHLEAASSFTGVLVLGARNTAVEDSLKVEVYMAATTSANVSDGGVTWDAIMAGHVMAT